MAEPRSRQDATESGTEVFLMDTANLVSMDQFRELQDQTNKNNVKLDRIMALLEAERSVRSCSKEIPATVTSQDDAEEECSEQDYDDILSLHPAEDEKDMLADEKNLFASFEEGSEASSAPDTHIEAMESQLRGEEPVGPPLPETWKKVFNGRFSTKLEYKALQERMDAHRRPANCSELNVPLINKEVWQKLPPQAKKADLKVAQTQRALIKAACALAPVAGSLRQKEHIDNTIDTLALIGHATRELSGMRKSLLRPFMGNLRSLCDEGHTEVTTQLFGDDLPASIKALREFERIGTAVGGRGNPSYRTNSNTRHQPFLGRGHSPNFRGPYQKQKGFNNRGRGQWNKNRHQPYSQ